MLGKDYFRKRLFDLYELSPVKYLNGKGFISDNNNKISIDFELNVSISGDVIFVISTDEVIINQSNTRNLKEWELEGESDGGFRIKGRKGYINVYLLGDKNNTSDNTYFCGFSSLDIQKKELENINHIVGFINNFHFSGRNFNVSLENHEFKFLQHEKDKELLKMFQIGRINRAFFSVISTIVQDKEDLNAVIKILDNISCLLSFFSMNMSIVPVLKIYDNENNMIGLSIRNFLLFPHIMNKQILDNFYIRNGIKNGIEQCYDSFLSFENTLNLKALINGLIAMMVQPYTDLKIAILLVSYELLLSKYLVLKGIKEENITSMSIQDKLRRMNGFLRFIPSNLLSDDLRANVRNPLFHKGEIPFSSPDEIYSTFSKYWELLIQIILKILNYTGDYLELNSNTKKQVPWTSTPPQVTDK